MIPPSRGDPLRRPFMATVMVYTAVIGACLMVDAFVSGWSASLALSGVSFPWPAGIGLLMFSGGVMSLKGLIRHAGDITTEWRWQSTGAILAAGGWLMFATFSVIAYPAQVVPWLQGLFLGVAYLRRFRQVAGQSAKARRKVRGQ